MNWVNGGERDGDGSEVERSLGRERRILGFSESSRSLGMDDGFFNFVRLMYGVRPVEEEAAGPGPGSENRTRFLGLFGVLGSREARFSGLDCLALWFVPLSRSATAVLARLLRRTAMGRSSGSSSCMFVMAFLVISDTVVFCERNCEMQ